MTQGATRTATRTQYCLLGPVDVFRDGHRAELGGRKQRAALAMLLLEAGRVVSTDRLLDAVWGDDHPSSASAGLQAYISNLRRVLRDDARATSPILRKGSGYLIDIAADDLDTVRFATECSAAQSAVDAGDWTAAVDAARRAEHLWRGPVLADYADEEWVRVAAAPLEEQHAVVRQNLVVGLLGTGQVGEAVARSRRLVDDQPLAERACWLHAVSLYRAGRAPEALESLQAHARRLSEELGLDTGPALRDVQGAILRQDAALATWPVETSANRTPPVVEPDAQPDARPDARPDSQPGADAADPAGSSDLVGRRPELETARALLDRVDEGLRLLVLSGPAGIGKTRLAEEIAAAWPGRLVRAGCPDDDGVPAWWPVRQVLRGIGADPDALLTPQPGVDADAARFAAYDGVARALAAAAHDEPLLLLVEDVHWADTASLRMLAHLAAASSATLSGLGLLLTCRDDEGGPKVERLLATVARRPGSRHLALPALSTDEVGALARQVSGRPVDEQEARSLTRRTGGNAFFVTEYARLSDDERDELPVAVRSVLGRRLSGLDPAVLQVLRTAALIGDRLEIDLLAAVTRLDRDELADLLDEAADEHVIVVAPGGGAYVFAHALLRDEVVAGLSPVRRQRLHLRVADAVGPGGDTDRLVRRAAHLVAAQPLADAHDVYAACRAAALDAESRWDPDSAAHWWALTLEAFDQLAEPSDHDRDDLVVAQVAALARAGRGQTVLDVIDAALLDAVRRDRLDSAGRLASTLLRTSGSWPWAAYGGDPGPLLTRLAGVESLVDDNPAAHVSLLAALAVGSCYDPDPNVPDRLSARALSIAETLDDDDALADALLGRALTYSGVAERAVESVRILDRLAGLDHRLRALDEVISHGLLFLARLPLGDAQSAAEHAHFGALGSDLLRLATSRVQFRWAEGTLALVHGDLDLAEAHYARAAELHEQTELYRSGVFEVARFTLAWERGRLDRIDVSQFDARTLPWAAAVCAVATDDPAAGELLATEVARVEAPRWTTHSRLTMLAHAVADAGAREQAASLIERLTPLTECLANIGQCGAVGAVGVGLARLHLLLGDHDRARTAVEAAEAVALRAQAPGSLLRCRMLRARLDDAGREEWSAIADEARRRGLDGVAAEADTALSTVGARSQRQ
ncbi:BTAD domain-containing putative transcriptional regulator [uncultured Jatrophihabitans sp.]|uniref:BTAD domain-containing putative transcriptional regulator n=1 Tax=uncultured Jatrophihabitans sp. TaxID=1610747 RepID=UPI0035CC6399